MQCMNETACDKPEVYCALCAYREYRDYRDYPKSILELADAALVCNRAKQARQLLLKCLPSSYLRMC